MILGRPHLSRPHQQALQHVFRLQADVLLGRELVGVRDAQRHRRLREHQEHQGREHQVDGVVQVQRAEFAPVDAALQDAPHQPVARLHHLLAVEAGDLGKIVGLAQDELAQARGLGGAHALPPALEAVFHQLAARSLEGFQLQVPFCEAAGDVLAHHGLEQVFLAREIEEQRAFGDSGADGDLVHLGCGEAFLHEQVQRRLEQFAGAGFLAAATAWRRGRDGVGEGGGHEIND